MILILSMLRARRMMLLRPKFWSNSFWSTKFQQQIQKIQIKFGSSKKGAGSCPRHDVNNARRPKGEVNQGAMQGCLVFFLSSCPILSKFQAVKTSFCYGFMNILYNQPIFSSKLGVGRQFIIVKVFLGSYKLLPIVNFIIITINISTGTPPFANKYIIYYYNLI